MSIKNSLPFIRCERSQEFSFFMLPKQMFTDARFEGLTTDAIVLYSILMNRVSLSMKNGWWDKNGNVYIIYPREEITAEIGWKKNKVIELFKQLREYGLIEEVRRGMGKSNLIYVKSFSKPIQDEVPPHPDTDEKEPENTGAEPNSQEVGNSNFKKFEKPTSRGLKSQLQEVGKTNPIDNNIINNYLSDNYSVCQSKDTYYPEDEKVNADEWDNYVFPSIDPEEDLSSDAEGIGTSIIGIMANLWDMEKFESKNRSWTRKEIRRRISSITNRDVETIAYRVQEYSENNSISNLFLFLSVSILDAPDTNDLWWRQEVNDNL